MTSAGFSFCQCNQLAPPSAWHLFMRLGVVWGREPYPCHSTPSESPPWTLYLATPGGYFWPFCLRTCPNELPVACCLVFLCSSPPEFHVHISSKTSQPTAGESIQNYWNYPTPASSRMSPKNLQPPSPITGGHLKPVLKDFAAGLWADESSPRTQPPILSSTCWTQYSWPAPSFGLIASRRIQFTSGWLAVCHL